MKVYIAGYKSSNKRLPHEYGNGSNYTFIPVAFGSFEDCETQILEQFRIDSTENVTWVGVPNVGEYVRLSNSFKTYSLYKQTYVQIVIFESTVR